MRNFALVGALLFVVGGGACATTLNPELDRGAPPPPSLTTDEDFGEARAEYSALTPGGVRRAEWRKALLAYLLPRVSELLDKGNDDAVEAFRNACSLYEPEELGSPEAPPELGRLGERLAKLYAPRGAEEPVVLGLAVAASLDKNKRPAWEERLRWIDEFEVSAGGAAKHWSKVIEALEAALRVWPAPLVSSKLGELYLKRHEALVAAVRRGPRGDASALVAGQEAGATHTAYKLAALYLRIGQPEEAKRALGKIADQPGDDPQLRQLLTAAMKSGKASDSVELAKYFIRPSVADREVAMKICMQASERFPKEPDPKICAAEMAFSTMAARAPLSIKLLGEAVALAPNQRPPAELYAKLRLARLPVRFGEESARVDRVVPEAESLAKFIEETQKRFPDKPFEPSVADVWLELGRGYYNAGVPETSERYLNRSLEVDPSWEAYHQIGLLRMKQKKMNEAVTFFERALSVPTRSLRESIEVRARVNRDRGEVLDRMNRAREARAARMQALEAWTQMLALVQDPGRAAEAEVERGRLLYDLGKPRDAIEALDKAIDVAPQRPETYAEVIAFLVPRGHLHEALDAYHRVLGRSDVSEYIKVYTSLWVIDLARRSNEPLDPLAEQFLAGTDGKKWYDDLARWASGRLTWPQLEARANTPARRAEAYFYRAQGLLAGGKEREARELWRKVLSTEMMAFFEFDMADYYLRKGAPKKAPPLPAPVRSAPTPEAVDDSI